MPKGGNRRRGAKKWGYRRGPAYVLGKGTRPHRSKKTYRRRPKHPDQPVD